MHLYDELPPLVQEKGVCFRCTAAGRRHRLAFRAGTRPPGAEHPGGRRYCERHLQLYSSTQHDPSGPHYDDSWKQAQALGYAEADPLHRRGRHDTWHKVILFNTLPRREPGQGKPSLWRASATLRQSDVEKSCAHGPGVQADLYGQGKTASSAPMSSPLWSKMASRKPLRFQ